MALEQGCGQEPVLEGCALFKAGCILPPPGKHLEARLPGCLMGAHLPGSRRSSETASDW